MSRDIPARAILAGAAVMVLAGCGAAGTASTPQVSMGVGKAASNSARAVASAPSGAGSSGAGPSGAGSSGAVHGSSSGATSNSYVAPVAIPFPDTVGDTWVYQTTANVTGTTGRTTDRIISSGPAAAGYQVTMAQTVQVGGSAISTEPVYVFYPSGKVGFPVPDANGVSVQGNGVTWPDSAGLASGQAYHSVVRVSQAGVAVDQNAHVTVTGAGTVPVTVPAGTYLATLVNMTITTQIGDYTATVVVKTWLAPNLGPVQSEVLTQAGSQAKLITTNRLLSFVKGVAPGGS